MNGSYPYRIHVWVYIYMLTWLGYLDGKCYHIYSMHGSYGIIVSHVSLSPRWTTNLWRPRGWVGMHHCHDLVTPEGLAGSRAEFARADQGVGAENCLWYGTGWWFDGAGKREREKERETCGICMFLSFLFKRWTRIVTRCHQNNGLVYSLKLPRWPALHSIRWWGFFGLLFAFAGGFVSN